MQEGDTVPEGDADSRTFRSVARAPLQRSQSFERNTGPAKPTPGAATWQPYKSPNGDSAPPSRLGGPQRKRISKEDAAAAAAPPPPPPTGSDGQVYYDLSDGPPPPPPPADSKLVARKRLSVTPDAIKITPPGDSETVPVASVPVTGELALLVAPPLETAPAAAITLPKRTLKLARADGDVPPSAPPAAGAMRLPRKGEGAGANASSLQPAAAVPPVHAAGPTGGVRSSPAPGSPSMELPPADDATVPEASAASMPITYMKPQLSASSVSVVGRPPPAAEPPPPPPAPEVKPKGTPLKKRLSFGREKKKPAEVAVAAPPTPAPKPPKKDGEMDDEDLEQYLMHLALTHDREREEFERAESDGAAVS